MESIDKKVRLRIEEIRKQRIAQIREEIAKAPLDTTLFKIEYFAARNDGHPNHNDAVKYALQKISDDKLSHYMKLEDNNIRYNF